MTRWGMPTWVLTSGSADGSSLVLVDSNPLTLSASGDAALWSTGCNNYEADVSVDGNAVAFFTVAGTEEDCDDLVAELEDAFLGALERIDVLERNREQLLLSGESVELTFVPRPDA
ncbi:MAG: META domain-containing protein [Acidimicrobiales bacterium]